jgi:hypothetical protein
MLNYFKPLLFLFLFNMVHYCWSFKRYKKAVSIVEDKLWPNGLVPFEISNDYHDDQILTFYKAMRLWESQTCILFIERNEFHSNWINILKQECGCCSMVGRSGILGSQNVSLNDECNKVGIAAHEFGHVIGFWHEHTRPDRDLFISLVENNIKRGQEINFQKKNFSEIGSLSKYYDFSSIMHYAKNTFSKHSFLQTIRITQNDSIPTGQRRDLSEDDINHCNKIYNCPSRYSAKKHR